MEVLQIIVQSIVTFLAGVMVGGTLQHKYGWLDKIINILT